jgi:hypothetical protein
MKEMQEAAERIGTAIKDGKLEPTGEKLKERAEKELQDWGSSIAGDRFKSVESGE